MSPKRPVIGVPADRRMIGQHPFHAVGEKYLLAVAEAAGGCRCSFRRWATCSSWTRCSTSSTASLFTGSPSNVEPHHYCGPAERARHAARCRARCDHAAADSGGGDARRSGARHLPRLPGNERGLRRHAHQKLHEVPGYLDHRDDEIAAARRAVRPGARRRAGEGGLLRTLRRQRPHPREFAALAGRRAARATTSSSRRARPTASSRPSACGARRASRSPCSGIRSGR